MSTIDDRVTALTERAVRAECGRSVVTTPPPVDTSKLPPGPRWPVLAQSAGLLRFRHRFVPWAHRKYGDVFTVRIIPRGRPLVLFTRPEHAKEIFAGDPEVFHAGKGNAILGPIMGEHSLLLQDSARAQARPQAADAGLQRPRAARATRRWSPRSRGPRSPGGRTGEEFRSLDRMNALTLEVILRVVFGVTDERRLAELRPRVRRTVDVNPAILLGWGWPWLQKFGPWKGTVREPATSSTG